MLGKYLITTDNWFVAPDEKQYRAAWGECTILQDNFLGIKTNERSSNWFVKVGNEDDHIIIAGCQIHYAVKCNDRPDTGWIKENHLHNGRAVESLHPTKIFIPADY